MWPSQRGQAFCNYKRKLEALSVQGDAQQSSFAETVIESQLLFAVLHVPRTHAQAPVPVLGL